MPVGRCVGHVSSLKIHPVKSCKGVNLDNTWCHHEGLLNDRRWAVVDDNSGQCLSLKNYPPMCFIQPLLSDTCLRLEAPGVQPLIISLPLKTQETRDVQVANVNVKGGRGRYAGSEAKAWITKYLKTECSIYQIVESRNLIGHKHGRLAKESDKTGYAYFAPILVTTTEALDDLNKNCDISICMERFRPSIIVSGTITHDEDNWKSLRIGNDGPHLRFLKRCGRCPVTTVDPETADITEQEPLKTLRKYRLPLPENRKIEGHLPIFGVFFAVDKEGPVNVGDPVYECSEEAFCSLM